MAVHIDSSNLPEHDPPVSRAYAWMVFALTFGLMLSDYMSRQVINAVFPFLKAEWHLSDTELGSLVSVVALVVGISTFPISLAADRWGRVKSVTAMAIVWGLATVACGLSGNFVALFLARAVVGLGEAGYSSAGGAILTAVFPRRLHATVMGAFLAASLFGSVLGVVFGGMIAKSLGWQQAFILVGAGGLLLALAFPLLVKEPPRTARESGPALPFRQVLHELFRFRSVRWTYLASGLSIFVQGALIAWAPSFFNRYYGLDPAQAAVRAGVLVLVAGVGMTLGGVVVDRLSRERPENRLRVPAFYALASAVLLFGGLMLAPGDAQFVLIVLGLAIGAGFAGPSGAAVGECTHPAIRATVFATLILANNLIGLAPAPFVTGLVADRAGLDVALRLTPFAALLSAIVYLIAARYYREDRQVYGGAPSDSVSALEAEEAAGGSHP